MLGQVISEGTAYFQDEIKKIEEESLKKKIKKVNLTIVPDKEKISYEFLNDSMIIGKIQCCRSVNRPFYGKIIDGKIFSYDFTKKTVTDFGVAQPTQEKRDSSNHMEKYNQYGNPIYIENSIRITNRIELQYGRSWDDTWTMTTKIYFHYNNGQQLIRIKKINDWTEQDGTKGSKKQKMRISYTLNK